MPEIHFDRYYRYDDLTRLLRAYADEYPQLVQLESIGHSHEGRDIWALVVTNTATGPAEDKPALWIDANIHASELSPSTAALYLLNKLATQYGQDDAITALLDTRTFYIVPRLNPDGAEWALADVPKIIRSSTRPYPYDEESLPGFEREDVDGDGRMLSMRIPDPNGPWKAHPDEPRLLVRRDPTETGGQYYRMLPEGVIGDYDGYTITEKVIKEGLDLNRNFPMGWRQEQEQKGAGPYPASEPEVRAAVDFIVRHPNITGAITLHTLSGVLLRPYSTHPDEQFPAEDLWTFQTIGAKGTEITGYPHVSVYHDFRYHPKEVISGGFDDWAFEHFGVYSWTVEIWSPQKQAGIEDYKFIEWYRDHPFEDDLKLLKWSDEVLEGRGYIDWYEFDHPQLGKIELGGWDTLYAWRNPPPPFLEKEVAPIADWMIWHLQISPRLELLAADVERLDGDVFKITAVVQNTGWLPTSVSKRAEQAKLVRGVVCELDLPDGATLRTGKTRVELGQLQGRTGTPSSAIPWAVGATTSDRAKAEWVVQAQPGSEVTLTARHPRAGKVTTALTLD